MGILARKEEDKLIKIKENGTTLDRIWGNLVFGDEQILLTAKEQELKARYEMAWHFLCEHKSTQQAVAELQAEFPNLSPAQYYRDVAATKRLFGDITKSNKAADTFLLSEMAMYAFNVAKTLYDVEGMNKAIANLIKIKGLDKDDYELLSDEDATEHNYYMIVNVDGKAEKIELTCLNDVPNASKGLLKRISDEITDIEAIEYMKK